MIKYQAYREAWEEAVQKFGPKSPEAKRALKAYQRKLVVHLKEKA